LLAAMNSVPDAIVHYVLSRMSNARDVASCTCVSKRWKDCIPYVPALYFPRNLFDGIPISNADAIIGRMVAQALRLEELIIYCPFSAASLASWVSLRGRSLRRLELRVDSIVEKRPLEADVSFGRLDCIGCAERLESLKLWGVCLTTSPRWSSFEKLCTLEIVGAAFRDTALSDTIGACPNLTDLALLGCDGVSSFSIDLMMLEKCRLDFLGPGNRSLCINCPRLEVLEIQGFSWILVKQNHCLRKVSISKTAGRVNVVDTGKLPALEYLSLRGVQWSWNAISSILQCAYEVKHLVMKIEFSGDFDRLQPFPPVDLVQFFNSHPKLRIFEIHGALFAALCQKESLHSLDSKFLIPCLEEVTVTVRSPLNAEQKLNTLESLVKYSRRLQKMVIRISQMKNCNDMADDFFEDICRFRYINNKKVCIE
ncbi:hypothetical protein Taro_035806, partial [Colocasia esculenta]|nr:hypothetical protein [Colocasia esculenta]